MKKPKTIFALFLLTSGVAAVTMYLVGWRSILGIAGASIGAGLTVALVTRRSD